MAFRFDKTRHVYTLDGDVLPHITGILKASGWVDDTWFTEASSRRGTRVHDLTADFDWGVPDEAPFDLRPYVLAYERVMVALGCPVWSHIEEPMFHPTHRFAGRIDRIGTVRNRPTIAEIKSGVTHKSHAVQTALQAVLASGQIGGVPAEQYRRLGIYLRDSGKFSVDEFTHLHDLMEANRLIGEYCYAGRTQTLACASETPSRLEVPRARQAREGGQASRARTGRVLPVSAVRVPQRTSSAARRPRSA